MMRLRARPFRALLAAWMVQAGALEVSVSRLVAQDAVAHGASENLPPGYEALVDQALAEYRAGNFREARALFGRAHAVLPNARSLRGLGMVEFELRNYAASIAFLEQALASDVRPLEAALRTETEQLLARAQSFVGHYDLTVEPAGVSVFVDGQPVAVQRRHALVLGLGNHKLEFRAEGYITQRKPLQVRGGEREPLQVVLVAVQSAAALQAAHDEASGRPPLYKNPWLWTAVGVLVVGGAAGAGVALGGSSDDSTPRYAGSTGVDLDGP